MAGFHQPEANDKVKSDKVSDVGEHIESDDDTSQHRRLPCGLPRGRLTGGVDGIQAPELMFAPEKVSRTVHEDKGLS